MFSQDSGARPDEPRLAQLSAGAPRRSRGGSAAVALGGSIRDIRDEIACSTATAAQPVLANEVELRFPAGPRRPDHMFLLCLQRGRPAFDGRDR